MKAKFIGKNGSLGLEYNKIYDIKIENPNGENLIISGWRGVYAGKFWCPYDNINGFLRNWHPVVMEGVFKIVNV